ncbi:unnamed protein product [Blepharisma stoltei]|uniref:Uncharacterized protein n=1 Tax=Blepharisma stoltei TaxID=1481888 RepID=A0AAU9IT00_9CILI|nr:unnamed protein product [Blepharisma stoltei]
MGCAAAIPMKITISPNLNRTSISPVDNLYSLVEEVIQGVNKINAGLSVAIDKFETVTGLHNPKRGLACGVLALLGCIAAYLDGNLLKVNFHILDCTPGISMDFSKLSENLSNDFMLWVMVTKEIESAVEDYECLAVKFKSIIESYQDVALSLQTERSNYESQEFLKLKGIAKENKIKLKESAEFYGEVLGKIKNYMSELEGIQHGLQTQELTLEILRIGQHAKNREIDNPVILMEKIGDYIEDVSNRYMCFTIN